jgi:phage tail protein X
MTTGEIVTIRGEGITLDRYLTRKFRSYQPGYLERVLDVNPGLAALGVVLPVGTRFVLPPLTREEMDAAIEVVKLWE